MRKWPQVKASAYINRTIRPQIEEIPGLLDMLERVKETIPDIKWPIECRPASTEPVYRVMLEARSTTIELLGDWAWRISKHIQEYLGCIEQPVFILDCVKGGYIESPSTEHDSLE